MQQLKINYKVYAIDLYGFGDSVKDPNKYSLEQQIKLIEDFIDKMGIPKLALVGHGLGAMIAIEYARRHPDRVPRMLIASAPLFDPGDLDKRAAAAQTLEAARPEAPKSGPTNSALEATAMSTNTAMRTALLQARRSHAPSPDPAKVTRPDSETLVSKPTPSKEINNLLFKRLVEEKKLTPQKMLDLCFKTTEPEYKKLQVDIPKTDARAIPSSMMAFDAGQILDTLRLLPVSTVIVHGKNDEVIEAPGDEILHYLTGDKENGSLFPVLLDGIRHFPMLEHDRFFRLLSDFLEAPDVSKLEIKEIWKRRSH